MQHFKKVHDKEAPDFTAFVIPLCKAMEVIDNLVTSHVTVNKCMHLGKCSRATSLMVVDIGSHKWLCTVLRELLHKINIFLEAMVNIVVKLGPSTCDDFPFGWDPFLFILKGLDVIPKISKDEMEDFLSMVSAH